MTDTRLQDDLIGEFRAEQQFIGAQLARFDPLATALRKPAAQRLLSAGFLLLLEILCYAAAAGGVFTGIFYKRLYPLYLLVRFRREDYERLIGGPNVDNLHLLLFGMLGGIVLLFLWLGRCLRRIRLKNALLSRTGAVVKDFVGELLKRRAAINAIEQRHFAVLPGSSDASSIGKVGDAPGGLRDNTA